MQTLHLSLDQVDDSDRFRKDLGDIQTLAESIYTQGIIHPPLVRKVGDKYKLIAGGRRTAAYRLLATQFPDEHQTFAFNLREGIDAADASLLELEENVRRQEMDWRETTTAIAKIHSQYQRNANRAGESWTLRHTGDLFGYGTAHVSNALQLAKHIVANDKEVIACENPRQALQILLARKQKQVDMEIDKRRKAAVAARKAPPPPSPPEAALPVALPEFDDGSVPSALFAEADQKPEVMLDSYVYEHVLNADSIAWMQTTPLRFRGIYTDHPYGIEVTNLNMKHIGETSNEHDRDENISLFEPFLKGAWRVLEPESYLVCWCDIEHFGKLCDMARDVGFRVQRWSMRAQKGHGKNEAAQYNTTKDYEDVLVCAKPGALLSVRRPTSAIPWKWEKGERERYMHPFAKPQSCHRYLLETFFPAKCTILDPFMGEGSGVLAMQSMGYHYTGIDIVEEHVARARGHLLK